ncbi:MAG: glutamate--tRNA ligase [Bdellovibrionaceae bacterium]|nr:glutamate--tRNA ligase [Pseudobdellovibrionaceae bacterium]
MPNSSNTPFASNAPNASKTQNQSDQTAQTNAPVRVRFAPSPTGYLHVGGARSAYYNYLLARKFGGQFILRIEDTDQVRSTEESLRMVIQDLQWLGINWDEGPDSKTLADLGPCGPYRQSKRLDIYLNIANELIEAGKAYYCFLTDDELEEQREASAIGGRPTHLVSPYADWTLAQARAKLKEGARAVTRFRTSALVKDYVFQDLIRGEIKFPSDMVGDFVLLRSDGMPVYNFCCVVDDHLMKVSHVLRAEEHLPNTLRQMMIYEAMNWPLPQFGHLSLVLEEDRQKMSKRKGAASCNYFKEQGYLPEALKNFILLLGWSHPEGKEICTEAEVIQLFSTDRLHSSGAVFDGVKLKWMNGVYLRALSNEKLWAAIEPFLLAAGLTLPTDAAWQARSVEVFKTSMETLLDAVELYRPIDDSKFAVHQSESAETLAWESTPAVLKAWRASLQAHPTSTLTEVEFLKIQDETKALTAAKGKFLFMPIRVAVIGKPHGSELKTLVPLMSRESLIRRVDQVLLGY